MTQPATKRCGRCARVLPLAAFQKNGRRADGVQSQCRACKKATQAVWYALNGATQRARNERQRTRNAQHLWDYLSAHPCVDCGEADPVVLEFDHVRGEKTKALADMAWRGFSIERIGAEIAKCEVRCANCHRRKTAREQSWYSALDKPSLSATA